MLSPEEDVEAHALRRRGWSISRIARHLGRSRATVRAYLSGTRSPGKRARSTPSPFERIQEYVAIRLQDDPHVWASTLYDEVRQLGYERSYQRFTHELRVGGLRPHCEACTGVRGRPTIEIDHQPGDEIQWDFLELPCPWRPHTLLHVLVGTLAYSGRMRGAICAGEDEAQVVAGIDAVLRQLGGTARRWRFDRMSAVVLTGTGQVRQSFLEGAKFYRAEIAVCPPRRPNRKGVVESRNHFIAQRWWRTAAVHNDEEAQRSLDVFCVRTADALPRFDSIVHAVAQREQLQTLPPHPFPVISSETRLVGRSALVAYQGNSYYASPRLLGREVSVRVQRGADTLDIVTRDGAVVATHRMAPAGSGAIVRTLEQRRELEQLVLSAFTTARPCKRKENRPPSPAARAAAAALHEDVDAAARAVVVDLQQYATAVEEA